MKMNMEENNEEVVATPATEENATEATETPATEANEEAAE